MNLLLTTAASSWHASWEALRGARGHVVAPRDGAAQDLLGQAPVDQGQTTQGSVMENHRGQWVEVIPTPSTLLRHRCSCGAGFWTFDGYRGHYALAHVLDLEAV